MSTWGVRSRINRRGPWKRVRTRHNFRGTWTNRGAAEKVAARLRFHGRQAHTFQIPTRRLVLRERALHEARQLVGIMEQGDNNSGAKVLGIIAEAGGDGPEPWCGDTVAVCYLRAGSHAVQRGWAAVRNLGFLPGMRVLANKHRGEPGDIVAFTFDHTGLLEDYCTATGMSIDRRWATHVRTIEGNTGSTGAVSDSTTGGDGVYRKIRSLDLVDRIVRVQR